MKRRNRKHDPISSGHSRGVSVPASVAAEEGPGQWTRVSLFLARFFLGAVFLCSAFEKIVHPTAFAEAVYNYQILPDGLVNIAAIIIPWIELLLAILLIAGLWIEGTVFLCILLLTVFMGALAFNMARGLNIHCGCFSSVPSEGAPSPLWYLTRDGVFLLAAAFLGYHVLNPGGNRLYQGAPGRSGTKKPFRFPMN